MTGQIVLRGVASPNRRQPLLKSKSTGSVRFAEVAGGTAAECAAICCCCPCTLVNFLVLVAYRVPAGLCRRALRKKRRQRLIKQGLMSPRGRKLSVTFDEDFQVHPITLRDLIEMRPLELEKEVAELEKEMFDRFYGAGFWRSPSQRSERDFQ